MCKYRSYLVGRREVYDNPLVAPCCEVEAMELLGPAGGANPLSDGWGGARQVRRAVPIQRFKVMEGVSGVGAVRIRNRPPRSVAVPRSIQNWPACRQWCSSGGHSPGGDGVKVRSCVMICGGSH